MSSEQNKLTDAEKHALQLLLVPLVARDLHEQQYHAKSESELIGLAGRHISSYSTAGEGVLSRSDFLGFVALEYARVYRSLLGAYRILQPRQEEPGNLATPGHASAEPGYLDLVQIRFSRGKTIPDARWETFVQEVQAVFQASPQASLETVDLVICPLPDKQFFERLNTYAQFFLDRYPGVEMIATFRHHNRAIDATSPAEL